MEKSLNEAVRCGRACEVSFLLRDHPGINVNWANPHLRLSTALHFASISGQVEVVKLLLAHPAINVNVKDRSGTTPLSLVCESGNLSCVRLLLKDPRINVTLDDNKGCTPLWKACCFGHREAVEWLIASGKHLSETHKGSSYDGRHRTALEIARKRKNTEVVSLLKRFMAKSAQTRHEVRVKLGVLDELAAEVYALTVFLCDDLLQLKPALPITAFTATTRFFVIASKLPMELQMILCHRAVGSTKQNILHQDSEAAFKDLAQTLLLSYSHQSVDVKSNGA